jgi:rsbT co-antagonist protein RsbR
MTQLPFTRALLQVRHTDEDTRRRGKNVIAIAGILMLFSLIIGLVGIFAPAWRAVALVLGGLIVVWGGSVALARSGQVTAGAMVLIGSTLIALVMAPVLSGRIAFTPFFFLIPVLLGLITVRTETIWMVTLITLGSIGLLALLARNIPATPTTNFTIYSLSAVLIVIITAIGFVGARTTQRAIKASSYAQRQTEQIATALQREKDSLAERVQERTADLAQALEEARLLTAEQARLLEENARQRDVIRNLSVPVLPLDRGLLVIPVIGELDRDRLEDLRRQALGAIQTYQARRLLLDITGVPMLDMSVAESLLGTMQAARLLGAEVVLVGIRPEVAQGLVSLSLDTRLFQSFSTLQMALQALRPNAPAPLAAK